MFVGLPGFVEINGGGGGFPPAGTVLSSHCSGPSAQDSGNQDYTDAFGTIWNGMFTLWQQIADGFGGFYWQSQGNNNSDAFSSCWLPYGFGLYGDSGFSYVTWEGCGSGGEFGPTGSYYNYQYANGSGGSYWDSGSSIYDPPSAGTIIYESGTDYCCKVYYDGNNGYYVSDNCGGGCPSYGTLLYSVCSGYSAQDSGSQDYTDAAGRVWNGMFTLWQQFADGNCSYYWSSAGDNASDFYSSCWLPEGFSTSYSVQNMVESSYTDSEGIVVYILIFRGNVCDGSGGNYYNDINPIAGTTISTFPSVYPDTAGFWNSSGSYGVLNADGYGGYYYNAL